jgi:hypothetical protein
MGLQELTMSDIFLSVIEQYAKVSLRLIKDLKAYRAKAEALEAQLVEAQAVERALVISLHLVDPREGRGWFDSDTGDTLNPSDVSMLDKVVAETLVEDFSPIVIAAMRRVIASRGAPLAAQPLPLEDATSPVAPSDLSP